MEIRWRDATLTQAVLDGGGWKAVIVLLPRESFFLCGGDESTVADQAGGRIVIVGRYSENVH